MTGTGPLQMSGFTEEIPSLPDDYVFLDDSYPSNPKTQNPNLKKQSGIISSIIKLPSLETLQAGKNFLERTWKKLSDGVSNNQGKIIAVAAIIAFMVLTHFVGLIGTFAIGAVALIFLSRCRFL